MPAKMISIDEARSRVLAEAVPLSVERRPLGGVLGAVLAEDVVADISVPPFDNSGMDGFAVQAADTVDATPTSRPCCASRETLPAGYVATRPLVAGKRSRS